jgi:hypothetical protein
MYKWILNVDNCGNKNTPCKRRGNRFILRWVNGFWTRWPASGADGALLEALTDSAIRKGYLTRNICNLVPVYMPL